MLFKIVLVLSCIELISAQDDGLFTSPPIAQNNNDVTSQQQSVATTQQISAGTQGVSLSYSDNVLFTSPPLAVESNHIPDPVALLTNATSSVPPLSQSSTTSSPVLFTSETRTPASITFSTQSSTTAAPVTFSSRRTTTTASITTPSQRPSTASPITFSTQKTTQSTRRTDPSSTTNAPPRFETYSTTETWVPIHYPTSTSTPVNSFSKWPSTSHAPTYTHAPIYNSESNPDQSLIDLAISKILPSQTTCGYQNEKIPNTDQSLANIDEFPWLALLRYTYSFGFDAGFRCAGSLISRQYVLTAANCALTQHKLLDLRSVRLGEWKISSDYDCIVKYDREECAKKYLDVGVSKALIHPHYNCDYGNDNVALLRLNKLVHFSDFVKPICLPNSKLKAPNGGSLLVTAGWGATEYGHLSDVKTKLELPVLTDSECAKRLRPNMYVFKNQVCVGTNFFNGKCGPDYGAPVMNADRSGRPQWYLEGIIAAGFGFGKNGIPELYTRVPKYVEWILSTVAQDTLNAV